ncbi:hypothetical protein F383_28042 [Gossypium arboreum]|uniref:Uncharacterized protein n=1 Tax=Gossypium arboreum TaxID=29729 RepID=A0A0B0P220_GOSAR|nr:hypothetical protein F383_28042 [Gossypium arboreum]
MTHPYFIFITKAQHKTLIIFTISAQ